MSSGGFNFDHLNAYALGYYAGRAWGVEDNPFPGDKPERHLYKCGYDRGIADYCEVDDNNDCQHVDNEKDDSKPDFYCAKCGGRVNKP